MRKILLPIASLISAFTMAQSSYNLNQCIDYALENNFQIKQSQVNLKVKDQQLKQSKGSLLPTVSASLSPSANLYLNNKKNFNSFGFNMNLVEANWAVFNGFQNENRIQLTSQQKEIAIQNLEVLKNDISLNIVNLYLQVLLNKELLKVAQSQVKLSMKQLDLVQKQFKAGVVPRANIYDIEATLANDRLTLVQRENAIAKSLLNIQQQLQMPIQDNLSLADIELDNYIHKLTLHKPSKLYQEALDVRPEIKASVLEIEASETQIAIEKGAYLPSVSANYSLGTNYRKINGINQGNLPNQTWENLGNSIGVTLKVPLFSAYRNETNTQIAVLNKENAFLNLENQKYQLEQNIELAFLEANNAKMAYQASLKTVKAREVALSYANKRLKARTINNFDFETAKNNLIAAEANLAQAKYDFIFKVKVLEFYSGKSFDL